MVQVYNAAVSLTAPGRNLQDGGHLAALADQTIYGKDASRLLLSE
jgi:hypothetical protein